MAKLVMFRQSEAGLGQFVKLLWHKSLNTIIMNLL